jgi:hypothetical protein
VPSQGPKYGVPLDTEGGIRKVPDGAPPAKRTVDHFTMHLIPPVWLWRKRENGLMKTVGREMADVGVLFPVAGPRVGGRKFQREKSKSTHQCPAAPTLHTFFIHRLRG